MLDGLAAAQERVGKTAETAGKRGKRGGKEAGEGMKEAARFTDRAITRVKALIGTYIGFRTIRMAWAATREEIEKTEQATLKATEAQRAYLALSALRGEREEVQQAVWQMAIGASRPIEQVAPAYYTLLGGTAGMARERQQALMQQALLMGKTDPRASLESLVNLFATIGVQQPQLTPLQIGNLVSQIIEQAKSTPEEMAQYLPAILSTAKAGGVPIEVPSAMFTFATRRGGGVATSGTAVRSTLLGLIAPQAETLNEMKKLGFPTGGDLQTRLAWLAQVGLRLPPELQAGLGGRRGIEAVAAIAAEPRAFEAEIAMMAGTLREPGSLLQRKLSEMYGEVPAQRYLEQINQLKVLEQQAYQDPEALRQRAEMELVMVMAKRLGVSPFMREAIRANMKLRRGLGWEPIPEQTGVEKAFLDLLRQGYEPAQIMNVVFPEIAAAGGWGPDEGVSPDWPEPPSGMTGAEWMQDILRRGGAGPMQGDVNIYEGGHHYHTGEKRDPAGRATVPVGAGY